MPSIIQVPIDNTSIELNEFIATIEENNYDFYEENELFSLAKLLNRLNNNRRFLLDHIASELVDFSSFQKSNLYGHQAFVLHNTKRFQIRAVFWLEPSVNEVIYNSYHDHNFDLLTVGYFGPGYKTEAFSYLKEDVIGKIGETVCAEPEGIFNLSRGQILFYKAKKDIHNQIPPESMSVSLNVISHKNSFNHSQFEFDKNGFKISNYLHLSSNELIIRLTGILGTENEIDMLKTILAKHCNSHVKACAALAITQILPALNEQISVEVHNSKNKLLIDLFEREKAKYGSCLPV